MNQTIRHLIKEKYDMLPQKEKLVADYILKNYQQSILFSSTELAEMVGVSDTTVVRFAKSLGFSGFLQYKNSIKNEYAQTQKVYSSLSSLKEEEKSSSSLLDWYTSSLSRDISDFISNMPLDRIDAIADAILKCQTLYLFGISTDEVLVHFLKNYLPLLGIRCVSITHQGLSMKEKLFLMNESDCLLMSVYPTLQDDEYWTAAFAKQRKATLITVSDTEITARKLQADISISFHEQAETFFNSYVLQMIFSNALLLRLYEKNKDAASESLKEYENMLSL